ncbi:hypothetical protein [Hydrogenophaga sp.]|uniref:hypothetical protein n=1 Tax=Hydrogenophaga sp. TaxID=1904254 RepID=UPI0035B4C6D9
MEARTTPRIKGALADSHFHHRNYTQQGTPPLHLISPMNDQNMRYAVLAPIPTSLLLRCGNCSHDHGHGNRQPSEIGTKTIEKFWSSYNPADGLPAAAQEHIESILPNYYISELKVRNAFHASQEEYKALIDKDGPLYYDTEVDSRTASDYNGLATEEDPKGNKNKDRFDPMITGLALGDMRASEKLITKLHNNPGVFTGIGEITVFKEWVQHKVGKNLQANMSDQQRALIKLMKTCGSIGMPVILHCDVNDYHPDVNDVNHTSEDDEKTKPRYLDAILEFLKHPDCQNTTIIWAHACGLGKYSRALPSHLSNIEKLLESSDHQHVKVDLSWDTVAEQLLYTDEELKKGDKRNLDTKKLNDLVELISKHPDRFLFGSDSLSPNSTKIWDQTADTYQPLFESLKKLPNGEAVCEKFRIGNYIDNIRNARLKVRLWEKLCLPYAMAAITRRTDNALPRDVKIAISIAIKQAIKNANGVINGKITPLLAAAKNDNDNFNTIISKLIEVSAGDNAVQQEFSAKDLEQWATYIYPKNDQPAPWTANKKFVEILGKVNKLWGDEGKALDDLRDKVKKDSKEHKSLYATLPKESNVYSIALDYALRDAIIHRMMQVEINLEREMNINPQAKAIDDFPLSAKTLGEIWDQIMDPKRGNPKHDIYDDYVKQVVAEIEKAQSQRED